MAPSAAPKDATSHFGFEAKLWLTADELRNSTDSAATGPSNKQRQQPVT